MNVIVIPQYTIIMTIGPSNSGKSTLANEILLPFLRKNEIQHKYISSDNIRRSLLGQNLHKHDPKMLSMSKGAFEIFHNELEVYTQYPVNIPVIVVDSTNLSKVGRNKILDIAEKNGYNVIGLVFDYKTMDDYFKYTDAATNKREIKEQVRNMRKITLKELERNKFHAIHTISSIDNFQDVTFGYKQNTAGYKVEHKNVCVVGDLHGCYDEFIQLLLDDKGIYMEDDGSGIPIMKASQVAIEKDKYIHHVLVGDLVDKGEQVEKLIRFIDKNRDFFTIVEGNHDRWNYNYLKGKIKPSDDNNVLIDSYFDSVRLFEDEGNQELAEIFMRLYESMYTFVYNDKMIVTHAPCQNKYLGKSDKTSLKAMNTIRYPKSHDYATVEEYYDAKEDFFKFLIDDSAHNLPYHVFGHVMTKTVFMNKNKIGIDTGCVAGNLLSSVIFMDENRKPFVKKYRSTREATKELSPLFRSKLNEVDFGALDIDLQKRLKFCARNKINFISGTMSPVDKDTDLFDIESLFKGIEYYRNNNVKQFILQPKFMGSRCNLLLHVNDIAKCKAFSRNAFEIKPERLNSTKSLQQLFIELQLRYSEYFAISNLEYILFDGELLPWNAMGKDLIEREFMVAYKACNSEHDILRETGFEEVLKILEDKNTIFENDQTALAGHEISVLKSYNNFKHDILHIDVMQKALDKYKKQLDLFGSDGELEFKPFAILKTIAPDGSEENWISPEHTNLAMYHGINGGPYCFISEEEGKEQYMIVLNKEQVYEAKTADDAIIAFWQFVTEQNEMEGVVIKPNAAYVHGVAPYLKARNKEYLRLTYGFDYDALPVKTERLIEKKNIRRKLETSIKEYELGRQLLNIKMEDISIDNKKWLSIAVQLLSEQENEKMLDPRL